MTAPTVPGNPATLDTAADDVDRAARALVAARDAVAAHGRAVTAAWTGAASSAASATLTRSATNTLALAEACGGCGPALRGFAVELREAQRQFDDAARHAADGQARVLGSGSGAPVGTDLERERGLAVVRDATAAMNAARERARLANEAAARQIDAAALHLAGIAPPSSPPGTPPAPGAAGIAAAMGNVAASVGNAALHDPLAVGVVLAGGALTAVSAVGFAGGAVADATGAGAVVGLPLGGASAAGIATGLGIAGAGLAGLGLHAATDRRVQPFQTNADAEEPLPTAAPREVTGFTKHGDDQAQGRDGGRGVSDEAIEDAVANPVRPIREQGGGRYVYEGKDATVVLNGEGRVITTWAEHRTGWRIK